MCRTIGLLTQGDFTGCVHWAISPGRFNRICGTIGLLTKRDFTGYAVPLGYQSRGISRGILTIHICALH